MHTQCPADKRRVTFFLSADRETATAPANPIGRRRLAT